MFEDVFQLREKALLMDELQSLKVEQIGFEFFSQPGDRLQDAKGKVPTDYGCNLHGPHEPQAHQTEP